jgi:hypothetical protein
VGQQLRALPLVEVLVSGYVCHQLQVLSNLQVPKRVVSVGRAGGQNPLMYKERRVLNIEKVIR